MKRGRVSLKKEKAMPVLIDKKDLAVLHAVTKDVTRYNLHGVLIEKDGTLVGTNGHMLLTATRERENQGLDADAILPREDAEALKRAIPKNGLAVLGTEDGKFEAAAGGTTLSGELVDAEYPKWRNIRPTGEAKATVRLDARLLEHVVKAAIDYSGTSRREQIFLDIEIRDDLVPVVLKYAREDGGELEALVMPVRLK